MTKINPQKILFIKLGAGGEYENDCIEKAQTLRLGYIEVDNDLCRNGNWEAVHNYFTQQEKTKSSVATSHTNQIKQFYEEGEQTLWLTFYGNRLWWCFSKPDITLLSDKTKIRPVIGKWSDKDINGKGLVASNISGKLLKTQGFRGTICAVAEDKYALAKINGEKLNEVVEVEDAINVLKEKLSKLIVHLQWRDFEILIDLIFRQAGWQRVGANGETQKTLDLDLLSPVTGEKAIVQIKSQSNLDEFKDYREKFDNMGYDKFFYVVHSPEPDLLSYKNETDIMLYFNDKVTDWTIAAGLVEWVINKAS